MELGQSQTSFFIVYLKLSPQNSLTFRANSPENSLKFTKNSLKFTRKFTPNSP